MNDLISIIVPAYNAEKYIAKCIDSIINQTYRSLEIILIDDGSTDSTGRIIDEYAKKDNRIIVIHKENGGLVNARKTGIEIATGKFAGYVDADDWIDSNMYETLISIMKRYHTDIVCSGRIEEYVNQSIVCKNVLDEGLYEGESLKTLYSKMLYSGRYYRFGVFPTVWDKLFKIELLQKYQKSVPEEIAIGEDVACTYPCLLEANRIYICNKCMYHYRKHSESMLQTNRDNYEERVLILQNYLKNVFMNSIYWPVLKKQLGTYIMDMILNGANIHNEYSFATYLFNKYLFPFEKVEKDENIVLYGAGVVGQAFWEQNAKIQYCNIIKWIDKVPRFDLCYDVEIQGLESLQFVKNERVVVAILDKEVFMDIKKVLLMYGIDERNIVWENPLI